MSVTVESVQALFAPLLAGDTFAFFTDAVDDKVVWTVANDMNKTCLISGKHVGKDAIAMTLAQLVPFFSTESPARTSIDKILVSGDWATILLTTEGVSKSGHKLSDKGAWVCRIVNNKLVEVLDYCDTAAINELVKANSA